MNKKTKRLCSVISYKHVSCALFVQIFSYVLRLRFISKDIRIKAKDKDLKLC